MTNKPLIGSGLLALGLFLFWVLPYSEYTKISALRAAIEERDAIIKERTETQARIQQYAAEYEQQSGEISTLVAVVPAKQDTAEMISAVENIGAQTGIIVGEVTFSTAAKGETAYNTMAIVINGQGSYPSIRNFLGSIERNIRLIDVQSLQISEDQSGRLNFQVKANAYFLK